MSHSLSLCKGIGTFGWPFFFVWRAGFLMLPVSPLYSLNNPYEVLVAAVLIGLPFVIVMICSARIKSISVLIFISMMGICFLILESALSAIMPMPALLDIAVFMLSFCCLQIGWDYFSVTWRSYLVTGIRCIVMSVVLATCVLLSSAFILPVMNLCGLFSGVLLIVCLKGIQQTDPALSEFGDRKNVEKSDVLSFIWSCFASMVIGFGVGCILVGSDTVGAALTCIAVSLIFSGLINFAIAASRITVVKNTIVIAIAYAVVFPAMVALPLLQGEYVAVAGGILIFIGRTQSILNSKVDLGIAPVSSKKYNSFLSAAFSLVDMLVVFVTASGLTFFFSSFRATEARYVFCSAILFVLVFAFLCYFIYTIHNYDSGVDSWARKLAKFAADYGLSPRQKEVFELLSYGKGCKEISQELFISTATTKSHIYAIYKKFNVHSQKDLIDLISKKN